MPFNIVRNDITKMKTDAIVNAANQRLLAGGGVCGAIFEAAGREKLQRACDKIGYVDVGDAVITKGFNLPAKYIIHTAGPIWRGGGNNEETLLYNCYQNSLKLAQKNKIKSIAFPVISSGIFGYPKAAAIDVAVNSIGDFLENNGMDVTLVVFDRDAFELSANLYQDIKAYIDNNYVLKNLSESESRCMQDEIKFPERLQSLQEGHAQIAQQKSPKAYQVAPDESGQQTSPKSFQAAPKELAQQPVTYGSMKKPVKLQSDILSALKNLDESFSQCLLRMIDEKGLTDVETYKRANIDRKLFSKIRKDADYKPKKVTAVAFAIALKLSLEETNALLAKAGYVLSHSSKFDVIIEFFITNGNYNIMEINEALFAFDQVLIGG